MLKSIYGYTINMEGNDPIISVVVEAIATATVAGQPGAWLVDTIPACMATRPCKTNACADLTIVRRLPDWFPGTHFKRVAREISSTMRDFCDKPWAFVKQEMAKGTHESSFVSRLHDQAEGCLTGEDAHVARTAANGLYGGGADTVSLPGP